MKQRIDANTTRISDRRIVLSENKAKITFINNGQEIRKIKIDGGVFEEGGSEERCDYLIIPPSNVEYFVELKGSEINKAISQLKNTIEKVSLNRSMQVKHAFIISSNIGRLTQTNLQNEKSKMKRAYSCSLVLKKSNCEYNLQSSAFTT